MNVWNFTGNLGKDAEVKATQSGATVCSFSVAVKSGYGERAKTTWVQCALFGKRAEGQLPQHLTKGTQVAISGEACLEEWEANGQQNKMLKVAIDKLDLIGGKPEAPQQSYGQSQGFAPQQPPQMAPQQPSQNFAPQSVQAQNVAGQSQAPQQYAQSKPAPDFNNQAQFDSDMPF